MVLQVISPAETVVPSPTVMEVGGMEILRLTLEGTSVLFSGARIEGFAPKAFDLRRQSRLVVARLWDEYSSDTAADEEAADALRTLEIRKTRMGKPVLFICGTQGPSVSIAYWGDTAWAAVCDPRFSVGVDAAGSKEFVERYPFERAFHSEEMLAARDHSGGTAQVAAALLWTAKEAAVKALGCGFHLVDPLDLRMEAAGMDGDELDFHAVLSSEVLCRLPLQTKDRVPVRSVRNGSGWISVAVVGSAHARA